MTEPRRPIVPPARNLPKAQRLPGSFELSADTFVVEEVPLYRPSGEGEHLYAWIEKRGWSTLPLIERIAKAVGCDAQEIGYAGLKDRHAVTRQWLSFSSDVESIDLTSLRIDGFELLDLARHTNKLKLGHLRGNRFRVELPLDPSTDPTATDPTAAVSGLRTNLEDLAARGVPNYFGAQRFGSGGRNIDKGLKLLASGPRGRDARRIPKPLLRLLVSAVQSECFNRVLAARIDTFDQLQDGDVAWLHSNGACFAVEDAVAERIRCERFEISPSGPLPGPKCLKPAGTQAELERAVAADLGVDDRAFGAFRTHPGERRSLRTPLRDPLVELIDEKPDHVRVSFELDRGAFATTVLRELVAEPPWIDERPEPTPGVSRGP